MNEHRIVEDRYESGRVYYRVQQKGERAGWSDVMTDYGPLQYTSLRKAKRAMSSMYQARPVSSRVVWP